MAWPPKPTCASCRDMADARDAAVRASRLDLDAAIRERDEANRTGLALVKAANVLQERIRVRDEALKLAAYALQAAGDALDTEGCNDSAHDAFVALAACRAAMESK